MLISRPSIKNSWTIIKRPRDGFEVPSFLCSSWASNGLWTSLQPLSASTLKTAQSETSLITWALCSIAPQASSFFSILSVAKDSNAIVPKSQVRKFPEQRLQSQRIPNLPIDRCSLNQRNWAKILVINVMAARARTSFLEMNHGNQNDKSLLHSISILIKLKYLHTKVLN